MYAFVAATRPRSVQARTTAGYKDRILQAFLKYVPSPEKADAPLYGLVYYFHNVKTETDADNISKPVWDSLEGSAFADDRVIRLRIAGVYDLSAGIGELDVTRMPDAVLADFYDMIGSNDHVVYVEFGSLRDSMYRFGMEVV